MTRASLRAIAAFGVAITLAPLGACGRDDARAPAGSRGATRAAPSEARAIVDDLRATFAGAPRAPMALQGDARATARAAIARTAAAPSEVTDVASGLAVSFQLRGARGVAGLRDGDVVVFRDALPGAHVVHVARPDGLEDHVAFDARPADESLAYAVDVSRVAGLRLVGDTLEMLDASGTPRLRVAPPHAIDARGAPITAHLDVAGCAVDRDPRPPWGRPVVAPGAAACEVRVRWTSATYPLLVDPAWTTTGAMAQARRRHALVLLADGRAFAIGGTAFDQNAAQTPLDSTELFDPASGKWAAGAPLPAPRVGHGAVTLTDGRVLVTGGESLDASSSQVTIASSVLYAPATAKWTSGPDMKSPRADFPAVLLPNGKVFVSRRNSELFDPTGAGAWTETAPTPTNTDFYAAAVSDAARHQVLLCGGYRPGTPGNIYETSNFRYDYTTDTWAQGANPMTSARARHLALSLPNGKVLVAGGVNGGVTSESSAELYDWAADTWTPAGTMSIGRTGPAGVLLPNGFALVGGGDASTDLFSVATSTWSTGGSMKDARVELTIVGLSTGEALAAGGLGGGNVLAGSERFGLALGVACPTDGQCLTGHCVDGVCCDSACTDGCQACSAKAKGSGADGTCGAVGAGLDPRNACAATPTSTCGASGQGCDGAGHCALWSATTSCGTDQCANGVATQSLCDGAGQCQRHNVNCGAYACAANECGTACDGDAQCAAGVVCDTASHTCVSATRCASDHEQQNPDGTTTDCGGYRCQGVACVATCASVDDCRAGYVCDRGAHCVQPPTNAASDGGGCAVMPASSRRDGDGLAACVAVVAAIASTLRRRRRS